MKRGQMRLDAAQLESFKIWLESCGAEVFPGVVEHEFLRVISRGETLSAYSKADGRQTWPLALRKLFLEFAAGHMVQLGGAVKQMSGNKRARVLQLAGRDGWHCWYCNWPLQPIDGVVVYINARVATVEEVCPRQFGGPNHLANQVLACPPCNWHAANKTVAAKVALREKIRSGPLTWQMPTSI